MDDLDRLKEMAGINESSTEDQEYHVEDASGDGYAVYYMGRDERLFIEANGVSIASAVLGGGGVMDTSIQDPKKLI